MIKASSVPDDAGMQMKEVVSMDIQKIISDLVAKLTGNKDLIAKFTADPLGAIKELLGIDLDPSKLGEVVEAVKAKLGGASGDIAKEATGFFAKLKSFFGLKKG